MKKEETARAELADIPVLFHEDAHTYTMAPGGHMLQGVTGMLSQLLFPDKYGRVPEWVLDRAKTYGSMVHSDIELLDELGLEAEAPHTITYRRLTDREGLRHERSEYLVSDMKAFASKIDKVWRDADNPRVFHLGDIKTTYKLDTDYVRWQLSVYAHLFEQCNPGLEVGRLLAVWVRGSDGYIEEVGRIPSGHVEELMEAWLRGAAYTPPAEYAPKHKEERQGIPDGLAALEKELEEAVRMERHYTARREELSARLMERMREDGAKRWDGGALTLTRKEAQTRSSIDTAKLKELHPDIYEECLRQSQTKETLIIKLKSKD